MNGDSPEHGTDYNNASLYSLTYDKHGTLIIVYSLQVLYYTRRKLTN